MTEILFKILVALVQLISLQWTSICGKFDGCFGYTFFKILTNALRECFAVFMSLFLVVCKLKATPIS